MSPRQSNCNQALGPVNPSTQAFTLVEMLVVMGVIAILLALIVPAFTQINASRTLSRGAYDIAGRLEEARAYAKANNTYTWVGIFEEDPTQTAGTVGRGRVVLSVVASTDATSIYKVTDTTQNALDKNYTPASPNLTQVGKLTKIDNISLMPVAFDPTILPTREVLPSDPNNPSAASGPVTSSQLIGSDAFKSHGSPSVQNAVTFKYPLGSGSSQPGAGGSNTTATYTFDKIIQFNPAGDAAKIVDLPVRLMEFDLVPARGNVVPGVSGSTATDAATKPKLCAAIQISGIGGRVQIYQP